MKKYILLIIMSLILLSGCFRKKVNHPFEIAKGNSVFSYFDSVEDIEIEDFNIVKLSSGNVIGLLNMEENCIMVDEIDENYIRNICIVDKEVITYKNISVGDSIDKIEDAFEYEDKSHDIYKVNFNGDTEEELTSQNKTDDWIWITYYTDGSNITKIAICDAKFARDLM